MLTGAEKGYLAMTLFFLATGSGIKAFRHASVEIGPSPEAPPAVSEAQSPDSASRGATRDAVGDTSVAALPEAVPSAPQERKTAASGKKAGFTGKVSINRAEAVELMSVRGLGDKTARAIVEYRRTHGPYRRLRDLLLVKGIGEKKLEKLIPYLIL
jgi:competence protein ComEA